MAVEAQVCPQCGAAIQFGVGQTQIVCGHCGTTVTKAAAPNSVEKEIEDEKRVQETVAREKILHGRGRAATATVVTAQATDIIRQAVEGRSVLMAFTLQVQPDGEAAFASEATALIGLEAVQKYQAGTILDVRYDPKNHAHVAVEGRHGAPPQNQQSGGPVTAKPAWSGGQQQQAHVGKPVPAGFEQVTDLGHVSSIHEQQSVRLTLSFGPPHASVVVRFHRGLAYRTHASGVSAWRWDEIAAIQSNLADQYGRNAFGMQREHEYTLVKNTGDKLVPDDGLKDVEDLMTVVKDAVFRLIGPPLEQRYQQGEALAFGPVTVQKKNGLQLDGQLYPWNGIQKVEVHDGEFRVTLPGGQKHKKNVSEIPNVELLCQYIGVKLGYHDLTRTQ